ncbi:A24 family peptidase [Starkeya sp. ORNL1]|uniref:prepilin peptidase n=1 Tax=Starkeya sp. ORNL1 TaxID=2709380 RepID=UPI001FEE840F|nr:A24 family peptidase [Starkeya sp. ORNL1]
MAMSMRATPFRTIVTLARHESRAMAAVAVIAAAGVVASLAIESGPSGVLAADLLLVVTAIAVIDGRSFIIPDELNAAGIVLGLAYAGLTEPSVTDGLMLAALRGGIVALAFLAIRSCYRRLRGRDGLGLGDVKLAAMAGVWLDWTMIPIAIDIAAGAALAAYGLRQLAVGRAVRSTGRLPFGLFFAPAIWLGWALGRWLMVGG